MKCEEAQELFGIYFDLPEVDFRRLAVDKHISTCTACREEFEFWSESTDLIRLAALEEPEMLPQAASIPSSVMDRIYRDESWRMPVTDRIYSIPYKLRRNLTAVIAFCLALFVFSFVYQMFGGNQTAEVNEAAQYGFQQIAQASSSPADSLNVHQMARPALASLGPAIIDPVKLGPIKTAPDYWLSLSILGLISTLLIMNWFTRTRA